MRLYQVLCSVWVVVGVVGFFGVGLGFVCVRDFFLSFQFIKF